MSKQRVFITGASGFLGANIVAKLVKNNYEVMAARRFHTNTWRCNGYNDRIRWVDMEAETFKDEVTLFNPEVIIHAAWSGVGASERDEWSIQLGNLQFLGVLFHIMKQCRVKKMVVLGSQAEYGNINGIVNEKDVTDPRNAYATVKIACQRIVETFCRQHDVAWYWLRIFSIFGPREDENWFIPSMILNQLKKVDSNLTSGEQKYDYLFVDDFAAMVEKIILSDSSTFGIYNISSGQTIALKAMVEKIAQLIGNDVRLNFGAIPYRKGQSMHMEGDNTKFNRVFGKTELTGLDIALDQTISYYKEVVNTSLKQEV